MVRSRDSLFLKLTLAFVGLGLVPLLGFSLVLAVLFAGNLSTSALANYGRILDYQARRVATMAAGYDQIIQLVYSYRASDSVAPGTALRRAVAQGGGDPVIEEFLSAVVNTDRSIRTAFLVPPSGRPWAVSGEGRELALDFDFRTVPWFAGVLAGGNRLAVVPPHPDVGYVRAPKTVLTFARNFYDIESLPSLDGGRILATLVLDVDARTVQSLFEGFDFGEGSFLVLTDAGGRRVYDGRDPRGEGVNTGLEPAAGTFHHLSRALSKPDWTLHLYVSRSSLDQRTTALTGWILLGALVCLAALLAFTVVFRRWFTAPLQTILRSIETIERGDLAIQIPVDRPDELGLLASSFNRMAAELQGHIERVYLTRIRQREAEMEALRARLEPHFLYNTLEVIRMGALGNRDTVTAAMIEALSVQLRYVLDGGADTVTLAQELAMVENYHYLLKARYDDRTQLETSVDPELLGRPVLKLTLQPLVENAVVHGFGPREWRGRIHLGAALGDRGMEVTVFDDGVGMDCDRLEVIRRALAGDERPVGREFLGLLGVHQRLRLFYGPSAGLEIDSSPGIGTVVRMLLPLEPSDPGAGL